MESANEILFPKMENFQLEWGLFEEQLQLQRSFDDVSFPPTIQSEIDFKPTNVLLECPNAPLMSSNGYNQQNITQGLENFGADFNLWSECPPLCELDDAWEPISHLPPLALPMLECSNNNPTNNSSICDNDQLLLTDYSFNDHYFNNNDDETLGMVVAQGLSKPKEEGVDYYVGDERAIVISQVDEFSKKQNNKGSKLHNSKVSKTESLQYDEIRKYFDVPISKAAKELNVGLTVLKKRCRELNIRRWPHRKLKSLKALIDNVKEMGLIELVETLEEHRRNLHLLPEMELTADTKKLRQACFKANYKKRRAMLLLTQ